MLCSRCGQDNPEQNRYCGMCGSRLQAPPEPANEAPPAQREPASRGKSAASSVLGLDADAGKGQPLQRETPISGPSFLGIGAEPETRSGSYSYLFDQEEPRSHRGVWIALVLLAAAALVGLQFRNEARARGRELYAAVLSRVYPQTLAPAPPVPSPAAAENAPQATSPAPATDAQAAAAPPQAQSQTASASAESKTGENAPTAVSSDEKPERAASSKSDAEESKSNSDPTKSTDEAQKTAPAKATRQPHKTALANQQKLARQEAPEDTHLLLLAQRYIRGEGVRRDCEQGLVYLRQALRQPSAAAATQMGALYATGTCVPFDRVQAYRWFGSALQITPRNQWLTQEREQLYAQMNSAERRQADSR